MSDETVTPDEPVAVESVSDVQSGAAAIEGLLDDHGSIQGDALVEGPAVEADSDTPTATEEVATAEVTNDVVEGDDTKVEVEADADEAQADDVEPLIDVTLPGGDRAQVTLEDLRRSYSREADYTAKTERVAAERREVASEREQVKAALDQGRLQYTQRLSQLEAELGYKNSAKQVDWDTLREEDPIEFATQWADHQRSLEVQRQVQAERQNQEAQLQRQASEQHAAALSEQRRVLIEAVPEFSDPEKGPALQGEIRQFLSGAYGGFSDDEISNATDQRIVRMARDAMRYQAIQAKAAQVASEKKVVDLPEVTKPTAPKAKEERDAEAVVAKFNRLKKSGSIDDAAAMLRDII